MLAYIIRRVAQSALVLLIVGLVAFAMFRFVGDPIDNMLGQERTAEDIERLRAQLGLDQPFVVQYYRFLENAVQGNFGVSYRQGRPVIDILMERAPATLELAAVTGAGETQDGARARRAAAAGAERKRRSTCIAAAPKTCRIGRRSETEDLSTAWMSCFRVTSAAPRLPWWWWGCVLDEGSVP